MKMVCALDETALREVAPVVRSSSPSNRQLRASSSDWQICIDKFLTATPPFMSSSILSYAACTPMFSGGASKSTIYKNDVIYDG